MTLYGIQVVHLLLWTATLSLLSFNSNGETYCVRPPNSTIPRPSEPCHELSYYARHNTFNTSNATFVFLPGNHTLNTTIVVVGVPNLTLTGDDRFENGLLGLSAPSSQIQCNRINGTGFVFGNLSNLVIKNILLLECVDRSGDTELGWAFGALKMYNIFNTTISRVTIQQSPGYGIVAKNLFGSITDSMFLISNDTLAHIEYNDDYEHNGDNNTFIIKASKFLNGNGRFSAGGLDFVMEKTYPGIIIMLDYITAVSNQGLHGGHLNILYSSIAPTSPSIIVSNSNFLDGHSQMYESGGVTVLVLSAQSHIANYPLMFRNCTFQNNSGRGRSSTVSVGCNVPNDEMAPFYLALFENCTFTKSPPALHTSILYSVIAFTSSKVTFSNCTFEDNTGTAITAVNSVSAFEGSTTFRNNSGTHGGALFLSAYSYMILRKNAHIQFINNHAEYVGGAIYVHEDDCISVHPCFFQVPATHLQTELYFKNNTAAEYGGTALYGGLLCSCLMNYGPLHPNTIGLLFETISGLHNTAAKPSTISSDPIEVCFCSNNIPDCDQKWRSISFYPGQSFNTSAITVGQRNGTVKGTVYANIDHGTIDDLQKLQIIESYQHCTNLTYTVFSLDKIAHLTVFESGYGRMYEDWPLPQVVQILLEQCPAGFVLTNNKTQSKCDCVPVLKKHHVSCDINKGTVRRPAKPWIGYYNASDNNKKDGVLYHPHCPFDYCKHTDMDIELTNPDEQCAFNHSGILCGSCKPGLSLALGTPQCLKCSNMYLTLLIPFSVGGLVLVFLLVVCNLTVTEGTLNGLIFYANIMWVNKAIFFPSNHTNILTVFLAWINLDLGIQTCFYDGMDAYGKTWLQFAFPLYIWTIVGLIIYLSRYGVVNRLVGQNAVKVLATLFLLSYAKLQRTIITALSFTFIQYPDGSKTYLWLFDGNVEYFTGKQIPLFMAGLAFFFFMSLPYTLALLLICYVRRIATPRYRLLRWIVRLLPLLDAYTAPYKLRYQFWRGFLLLVRLVLLPLFSLNYSNDPALNLMAVAIASLFVLTLTWSFRAVYKQWPLDVLESSFFFNLGIVSVIVLYTGVSQSTSDVAHASIGIAFSTFVGIMFYHCYKQLSKTELWRGLRATARSHLGAGRRDEGGETEPLLPRTDSPEPRERALPHFVYYDPRHYRDSVLEHLSDPRGDDQ